MVVEKSVKWTCPHCNNLHYYYWDEYDIFEGEVNMNCDSCHRHSKQMMHVEPITGNAWCESMKENYMKEFTSNLYWDKQIKWKCPKCNFENTELKKTIQKGQYSFQCHSCYEHSDVYVHIDLITGNGEGIPMELIRENQEKNKEPEITKETKVFLNSEKLKNFVDNLNPKSELEQLKKQVEVIQKRIKELEDEKKKDEYKSLHNVIAKWEYYYSERLEKRIMYGMHSGNVSYRDIVEEEIENLLKSIDEWIDKELSFNQTAYTAEYFVGWDECRKTLKKKLRSDSDFYGKTK